MYKIIYNTVTWAPAGGGQEGALAPPGNSKIWGPPQG